VSGETGGTIAPSNGSSAPTTAAPGVATSTPTPKSGEGAVVPKGTPGGSSLAKAPAPGQTENTAPAWQRVKFKVPGNDKYPEREVDLSNETEAQRLAIKAFRFDEERKRNLQYEQQQKAIAQAIAQKQHREVLKLQGLDFDALVEEEIRERVRRLEMPPEQLQAENFQRQQREIEQRAARAEAELQRLNQERQADMLWERETKPAILAAVQQEGVSLSPDFAQLLSVISEEYPEYSPLVWVREAKARLEEQDARIGANEPSVFAKRFHGAISKVPATELHGIIPEETLKELFRLQSEKLRAGKGQTSAQKPPSPQPPKTREYRTPGDWADSIRRK
jgi:hypothetical protein